MYTVHCTIIYFNHDTYKSLSRQKSSKLCTYHILTLDIDVEFDTVWSLNSEGGWEALIICSSPLLLASLQAGRDFESAVFHVPVSSFCITFQSNAKDINFLIFLPSITMTIMITMIIMIIVIIVIVMAISTILVSIGVEIFPDLPDFLRSEWLQLQRDDATNCDHRQ